jgi:Domain of unknown function (DUF4168)
MARSGGMRGRACVHLPDVLRRIRQASDWDFAVISIREVARRRPEIGQVGGNFRPQICLSRMPYGSAPASAGLRREEEDMQLSKTSLAVAVLTAAWVLSVPAAQAQSPSSLSVPSQTSIPDDRLDAAAAALERVVSLTQDYQERMLAAPPSKQDRIAEEAKKALVKAVTDQGLSITEYALILEAAQNDPDFRGKLLQRMNPSAD